ncbi:MAG TPA: PAS-domain containing protein, partial [Azonexus sp.]|nr:PAS-domain containing protein [Azonexus sp.]
MKGKQQLTGQSTVDRLSRRSALIFILLALVAVFTYFLLAGETADERASAAEINQAGKRRMLSQRIGLLASQFLHEEKAQDLAELARALTRMAAVHDALIHGDPQHGIRPPRTDRLRASYAGPEGVNAAMQRYLALGKALLQAVEAGDDYRASARQLVSMSQGEFLDALDQLVDQYQEESEESTDMLRLLQWCALLAALGLLAFSALGVLRPLITQVRRSLDEQAASEKALRQAVEKNHLILQAAGEGIFGVDRSGRISFANPAAATMLGTDSASLVGLPSHHDIMSTAAGCPICQVLNDSGEVRRSDGRFRRPGDDEGFPVEYSVAPRADGEGAVISFRDISERWQAELRLQRFQQRLVDAIEALDDAFALFDGEDRLTLYNLRFTESFPLRGEVIKIGMPFSEFVRAIAEQDFYAVPGDRMADWIGERMEVHRRAEGSTEIPLVGGRWLRTTERRTREGGTVVIWSDVSHLKQALIAADQASRAKSEFMARMSHELRTPLNAILGFAQVLEQGLEAPLTPRQIECVSHILQGGRHLLALINEVLDLSAIESGRLHIEMENLPLAPLLRECQALVSPL